MYWKEYFKNKTPRKMPAGDICLPYSVRMKVRRLDNFNMNALSISADIILTLTIKCTPNDVLTKEKS